MIDLMDNVSYSKIELLAIYLVLYTVISKKR